ncbi:MAG: hypothetical protein ACOVQH_06385, partial [Burkholderiaceae bacterium]
RLLRTHNQNEIANKLGLSKRKVSQVLAGIREHFARVDWSESGFSWDVVSSNCIASSGEDNRICKKCSQVNASLKLSEAQIARERGAKRLNGIPIEEQDTYEMNFF